MKAIICFGTAVAIGAAPVSVDPSLDRYAVPERLVRITSTRKMNLRCGGSGPSTIILEAGLGFASYSWRRVQPALERVSRTCSYDRAGLGFSDPGPLPRTAGRIADDLEILLRSARLKPPYLLVGGSMGSQPMRLFAFRHPERVIGMILVDPYVEGQNAALGRIHPSDPAEEARRAAAISACDQDLLLHRLSVGEAQDRGCIDKPYPEFSAKLADIVEHQRMSPSTVAATASERATYSSSSEVELRAATHSLGAMPIVVLTAGSDFNGNADEVGLLAELRQLHARLADLSTKGTERLVPGAGHVIQSTNPEAVIRAVEEVSAETQHRRK